MFVKRREFDALVREVRALRASQKDSNKSVVKRVDSLEKEVGVQEVFYPYSMGRLFDAFYGPTSREAKPFNLSQKVNAIMEHLGLREEISATTKLVKKPEPKAKKTATATEAAMSLKATKRRK